MPRRLSAAHRYRYRTALPFVRRRKRCSWYEAAGGLDAKRDPEACEHLPQHRQLVGWRWRSASIPGAEPIDEPRQRIGRRVQGEQDIAPGGARQFNGHCAAAAPRLRPPARTDVLPVPRGLR